MQRLVARSGLEAPHEVADAHTVFSCNVLKAELFGKMLFEPLLDLQDNHILMQFLPTEPHPSWHIVALHFVKNIAGDCLSNVGSAKTLDQINVQVAG